MSSLNNQFFERVSSRDHELVRYTAYQCKYPTAVLFDVATDCPLLGYVFKARDAIQVKTTLFARPSLAALQPLHDNNEPVQQMFQGVIDQERQPVEHVLTNFTTDAHLQVELIPVGARCEPLLPHGASLNDINVLPPMQSHVINYDPHHGNRALMLEKVMRAVQTPQDKAPRMEQVTVGQDEDECKESDPKKPALEGSYLFLTARCESSKPEWCNKFQKTEWRMVDSLVLQTAVPTPAPVFGAPAGFPQVMVRDYLNEQHVVLEELEEEMETQENLTTTRNLGQRLRGIFGGGGNRPRPRPRQKANRAVSRTERRRGEVVRDESEDDESEYVEMDAEPRPDVLFAHAVPEKAAVMYDMDATRVEVPDGNLDRARRAAAARVVHGEEVHNRPAAQEIEMMFDYERASHPCVVVLAVLEHGDMEWKAGTTSTALANKTRADALIKAYVTRAQKALFAHIKVFRSEQCCVCLDATPAITIAACGHTCICASPDCAEAADDSCPLCRGQVRAKLMIPI